MKRALLILTLSLILFSPAIVRGDTLQNPSCSFYNNIDDCLDDAQNLGRTGTGTEICGKYFETFVVPLDSCECQWNNDSNMCVLAYDAVPIIQSLCTDSDNGDVLSEKGYRLNKNSSYADYNVKSYDYCIKDPHIYPGSNSATADEGKKVDSCSGEGCYLIEYHCREDLSDAHRGYACPDGCSDGACGKISEKVCTDTDSGKDYFKKGTLTGRPNFDGPETITVSDCCIPDGETGGVCLDESNTLNEAYCEGDTLAWSTKTCSNGCSNGACIQSSDALNETRTPFIIKGKLVDKYTGEPLAGVLVEHVDNYGGWDGLESKHTDSEGFFEFKDTTFKSGYILSFSIDCYSSSGIVGDKDASGQLAFYHYDTSNYCNENRVIITNGVVDLGEVYLQPAADVEFKSDTAASFNVYQESKYCEYDIGGAGNSNEYKEHYSRNIVLLGYNNQFILNEQTDKIESEFFPISEQSGCYVLPVKYQDGEFSIGELRERESGSSGGAPGEGDIEIVPETVCGNEICERGEDYWNCRDDCNTVDLEEEDSGDFICSNGCESKEICYPLGYRKNGKYCNEEGFNFTKYKPAKETCENNFECKSNICIDDECISGGLFRRFTNWFRRVFGKD